MLNSRDSSIWRSLAVAFGDGVAFGVGVKLTQPPPSRSVGPATKVDLSPLAQLFLHQRKVFADKVQIEHSHLM